MCVSVCVLYDYIWMMAHPALKSCNSSRKYITYWLDIPCIGTWTLATESLSHLHNSRTAHLCRSLAHPVARLLGDGKVPGRELVGSLRVAHGAVRVAQRPTRAPFANLQSRIASSRLQFKTFSMNELKLSWNFFLIRNVALNEPTFVTDGLMDVWKDITIYRGRFAPSYSWFIISNQYHTLSYSSWAILRCLKWYSTAVG